MKFQDDISMPHTHTRTSRKQYVPHFFKVGGIIIGMKTMKGCNEKKRKMKWKLLLKGAFSMSDQSYAVHMKKTGTHKRIA